MELIQGNDINDMILLCPRVNTDNLKVVRKIGFNILYKYFISDLIEYMIVMRNKSSE